MIRFWLLTTALVVSLTSFSQNPTFINAAEVISRGKELYDSGKYAKSIALYQTIPKRDTGYVHMLPELALSFIANEEFEKALTACEEGLKKTSSYRAHLLRSQAIATDRNGDYDKAVKLFTEAIEAYPADFTLVYNLGITHYNHKAYEKAVDCFFKVLSINPFHPGSHLNLGRMSAGQGKKTHAMLSFGVYLGLSNDDNERLVFLEKLLSNQFQEENSLPFTGINAFDKLDQIIRAKIAMDKNYKSKIDIDAAIVRQYQMLFDQLESVAPVADRWSEYYIQMYKTLKEKEMIEPFIFHMLKSANIDAVKKWHAKNHRKLEAFYVITNEELKKKRAQVTMSAVGFEKPTQAWYYDNNRLEAIGNEDANGKRMGPWIYFKNNFERSAEGVYSDNGEKTGTWKYFNDDGTTRSVENYETGEVHIYQSGILSQHFFLKGDMIQGKVELFNDCGIKNEELIYVNGRRHGSGKKWFASGKVASTYTYDSNKVVDAFTNYFENGKIRDVLIYKDDKLEGKYSEYHPNGKLKSTGVYANDKQTGLWMYYHPNGRLESSGMYRQGLAVGPWNFYNERGGLFEKKHFNDEGKADGDNTIYDNEKIHYINTYKNDVLIGVTYLDSAGRQLGKFGNLSGTFNVKQYYSTGQLSAEGSYKNGKMHGPWQYYFPEGNKQSVFNYEGGTLQGEATEYFRSGAKKYIFHYTDGKFDGKFEEYYSHGQLKHHGWFTASERQQQWLSYFPNGVVESDFYYLNGELSGEGLEYSTTGKLLSASNYESDRLNDLVSYNANGNTITQRSGEPGRVSYQAKYKTGKLQSSFETRCGDYTKITRWFPDGKVFYAYELLSGLKEGSYQYNAINGRTLLQGNYTNGQEEGLWSGYHETGQLDYAGSYLAGKHDSTWVYYFPNGKISSTGEYRNGERHGITTIYGADGTPLLQKFYVDGNLTGYRKIAQSGKSEWTPFMGDASIILTYPNGKKAYEENYKRGVLDGPKRIYYPDGNLYSEYNYVLGDYHGTYRLFYPGNKPMENGTYKLDELHGTIEKFNEDGSILLSEEYNMGLRNGKSVLYEKGQKKIEYEFYGGIPYE